MTGNAEIKLSREPGVLLQCQKDWVADESPVKIAEKGRRIGFTWCEASDDTLYSASEGGDDTWYVGYNKDMALEFISDCATWARHYHQAASEVEELVLDDEKKSDGILSFRITFASGFRITALSSRPNNLRGKHGRVVIDEAAFHDDLAGLLKAAMAFLIWGGSVRIISTHLGDDSPFNELIEEIKKGRKKYSLHRVTFDDAIADGLYQRICLKLGKEYSKEAEAEWRQEIIDIYGDDADEELHVIPSSGRDIYFTTVMIQSCMSADYPVLKWRCQPGFEQLPIPVREQECKDWIEQHLDPVIAKLNPRLRSYFGEDFGLTGDLTSIWPGQQEVDLHITVPFAIELSQVPFEQQKQILFYLVDRLPRFTGGALDARGNGQVLAQVAMQRYGEARIEQVMISQNWYRETMPKYKARYEDRTITVPKNDGILHDHRAVRMIKGVAKVPDDYRPKKVDGVQRHGDSAISGAMLDHAVENLTAGEIEFESTGVERDAIAGMENF